MSVSDLFELLRRYLTARRAEGCKRGTLANEECRLRHFLSWLLTRGVSDVRRVTPQDVEAYRLELSRHRYRRSKAENAPWKALAQKTRAERLHGACAFLRFLVRERILIADPSSSCVIVYPRRPLPRNVLTEAEAATLLETPDPSTPLGLRDRAVLSLLYSSGLRRAEMSALDVNDLDLSSGTVFVRSGKGGKSRLTPLGDSAAEVLTKYLQNARPALVGKKRTSALFIGLGGQGKKNRGGRLIPFSIGLIVLQTAEKAGMKRRVTTHALRHSLATHLLRAGADIRHVQGILGHADVTATEIYTHVAVKDLADVHARSHPRGRLKGTRRPGLKKVWSP